MKHKATIRRKRTELNNIEQFVFNFLSCNNSVTLNEVKLAVRESLNVIISISKVSRIIQKIKFSRKRISLYPIERNTAEAIEARCIYATEVFQFPDSSLIFWMKQDLTSTQGGASVILRLIRKRI